MEKKLDEIISVLKGKFPFYTYINGLREQVEDISLENRFVIIVKDIHSCKIGQLQEFAYNEILLPMAKKDEELPLIITLQINDDNITQWKYFNPKRDAINLNDRLVSQSANDYNFKLAA